MVTLSYGALLGLLLAAFVIGLLAPLIVLVAIVFNAKVR